MENFIFCAVFTDTSVFIFKRVMESNYCMFYLTSTQRFIKNLVLSNKYLIADFYFKLRT